MTRARLFLILLVLLLFAVYYSWQATPRQQRLTGHSIARGQRATAADQPVASSHERLDLSGGERLPFKKPRRDLFRALYAPPPPAAHPVVVAKPMPVPKPHRVIVSPPPVVARPPMEPSGPSPIPPLKVLGYLQKEGTLKVFLASPAGEIYIVRQGQRFADNLLVRELTPARIVISRGMDDPGLTLAFGGAKSQRIKVVGGASNRPNLPTMENLDVNDLMPDNGAEPKARIGKNRPGQ